MIYPKAGNFCKAGRSLRKHNHKVESHKLNFTENAWIGRHAMKNYRLAAPTTTTLPNIRKRRRLRHTFHHPTQVGHRVTKPTRWYRLAGGNSYTGCGWNVKRSGWPPKTWTTTRDHLPFEQQRVRDAGELITVLHQPIRSERGQTINWSDSHSSTSRPIIETIVRRSAMTACYAYARDLSTWFRSSYIRDWCMVPVDTLEVIHTMKSILLEDLWIMQSLLDHVLFCVALGVWNASLHIGSCSSKIA